MRFITRFRTLAFQILFTLGAAVLGVSSSGAATFTGTATGSPSLSPVFGTLINFDAPFVVGDPVGASDYVSMGVASVLELEGLGSFARYTTSQSGCCYIGTGSGGERGGGGAALGWDGTIQFKFSSPADKVGIGIADSAGQQEQIAIYDSSHNLLDIFVAPIGANTYVGFDNTGFPNITFFEVRGDFFALDDLQFNSPIPEPEIYAMMGVGLMLMGFVARRRRGQAVA